MAWQTGWAKLIEEVPLILEAADVLVCGPSNNGQDLPPTANIEEGIYINGVASDGHEAFRLSYGQRSQHNFVKTLMKPYDTAISCILLRAYLLAPNNFSLR